MTLSDSKFVSHVADGCDEILWVAGLPSMVLELVEVKHLDLTVPVADDVDVEVHRDDPLVSDADAAGRS